MASILDVTCTKDSDVTSLNPAPYTHFFGEHRVELPAEYQARPDYVPVWGLLEQIVIVSDTEVGIKDWPNPRTELNGASFELGSKVGSEGRELY